MLDLLVPSPIYLSTVVAIKQKGHSHIPSFILQNKIIENKKDKLLKNKKMISLIKQLNMNKKLHFTHTRIINERPVFDFN